MRTVIKTLGFLIFALGASGCAEPPPGTATPITEVLSSPYETPDYVPVAFLNPPIRVAANRVSVIERFSDYAGVQPTEFITSPERVARLWAQQRLRTEGGGDRVEFIIEKVGARSDKEGNGEVVTVVLEVELLINPADGGASASAVVMVDSETRIAGPISPERRKAIYHQISLDVARKLDERLSESVQQRLAVHVNPARSRVAKATAPPQQPIAAAAPEPAKPLAAAKPVAPARKRVTARRPVSAVVPDSPLAGADGKLPSSAWRRGWNWKKTP